MHIWIYTYIYIHIHTHIFVSVVHTYTHTYRYGRCGHHDPIQHLYPIRKSKDYVSGIWVYKALDIWKGYYRVKKSLVRTWNREQRQEIINIWNITPNLHTNSHFEMWAEKWTIMQLYIYIYTKTFWNPMKNHPGTVTCLAIMHIFNEVRCWYSIPSKIFTQMIHVTNFF